MVTAYSMVSQAYYFVFSPVLGEAATVAASQGDMLAFVKVSGFQIHV